MGLDMYLRARSYYSPTSFMGEDNATKFAGLVEVTEVGDFLPEGEYDTHAYLEVCVGYWRKANHIHQWFVDNVQDGRDECQEAYFPREVLEKLKADCEIVLESPALAPEVLPVQEGFFFGSTEYDEYYFEDIKDTVKIIDRVLQMPEEWDFVYQSSW